MKKILFLLAIMFMTAGCTISPVTQKIQDAKITPSVLQEGKDVKIQGNFIRNTSDSELEPNIADGGSYQVIKTKENGEVKILIGGFRSNCLAKEIHQAVEGDIVEVYGKVISTSTISVCLSDKYYLKKQ